MNRLSRSPWMLLGALLLFCAAAWAQSNESLGDVARKNKEGAVTQKKSARVFTEDDIPASSSAMSSAPAAASAVAAEAASPAKDDKDTKKPADAKDSAAKAPEDPQKAEERKAKLKLADGFEQDAKNLETKYKALQEKYDNETDPFRKMVMENELANSKDNVAAMHKKADDLRKDAQSGGSAEASAAPAGQPTTQPPQ